MATLPIFVVHVQALRRCLGPHERRVKGYPEVPKTIGEHLRKRRLDLGLTQKQSARRFGISVTAYNGWEASRIKPGIARWPAVVAFLGDDPNPKPRTFGEALRAMRWLHGLNRRQLAAKLGVDVKSVLNWETGRTRPVPAHRRSLLRLSPTWRTLFVMP